MYRLYVLHNISTIPPPKKTNLSHEYFNIFVIQNKCNKIGGWGALHNWCPHPHQYGKEWFEKLILYYLWLFASSLIWQQSTLEEREHLQVYLRVRPFTPAESNGGESQVKANMFSSVYQFLSFIQFQGFPPVRAWVWITIATHSCSIVPMSQHIWWVTWRWSYVGVFYFYQASKQSDTSNGASCLQHPKFKPL